MSLALTSLVTPPSLLRLARQLMTIKNTNQIGVTTKVKPDMRARNKRHA